MGRRATKIQIKKSILIIGEGICEQFYFKQLNQTKEFHNFHFDTKTPPHPMPTDIVDRALMLKRNGNYNSIWCIFDLDKKKENQQNFENAVKKAKEHKIKIATILPCLELWYLLHFKKTTKPYNNCDEVLTDLKNYLPKYEKNEKYYLSTNIADLLSINLNDAIKNSKHLETFNIENKTNSSISEFHKIIENIRSL